MDFEISWRRRAASRKYAVVLFIFASACDPEPKAEREQTAAPAPNYTIEGSDFAASEREFEQYLENSGAYEEVLLGRDVSPGDYLEVVSIRPGGADSVSEDTALCSGVLIAENVVATAAHCIGDAADIGSIVAFGPFAPSEESGTGATDHTTARAIGAALPPRAIQGRVGGGAANELRQVPDVALLRLDSTPANILSATVANAADVDAARFARVVGFGINDERTVGRKIYGDIVVADPRCSGTTSVQAASVGAPDYYSCWKGREIVAGRNSAATRKCSIEQKQEDCRNWNAVRDRSLEPKDCSIGALKAKYADREFIDCADTCSGDSGGPLFITPAADAASAESYFTAMDAAASDTPRRLLAGITSRAVNNEYISAYTSLSGRNCGNGGIYTLIDGETATWISAQVACWAEDGALAFDESGPSDAPLAERLLCHGDAAVE